VVKNETTVSLVRAVSAARALQHVVKTEYEVSAATVDDIVMYMEMGASVENADFKNPVGGPPVSPEQELDAEPKEQDHESGSISFVNEEPVSMEPETVGEDTPPPPVQKILTATKVPSKVLSKPKPRPMVVKK
jgi:hypothetical protein